MIRRRRATREIPFSFDSFLDVVANVVGIIIRLILVVWVGARSYSSVQVQPKAAPAARAQSVAPADLSLPLDPLQQDIDRHQDELAEARARLLEQLRQLQLTREEEQEAEKQLGALAARRQGLEQEGTALEQAVTSQEPGKDTTELWLVGLKERQAKLLEEIRAVEKLPPLKKVLRYRTPVSRPVHTDEYFFECRRGRVTFLDISSLLAEVRRTVHAKGEQLRDRWEVSDVTIPVGAFRLRYVIQRERELIDNMVTTTPDAESNYRYGMGGWVVEPVADFRGETIAEALAAGSEFRQVADTLDPKQAVVTFWVYPDSFELFRQLRDHLYERDVVVAGRPLPEGVPIACSRNGSASRGQ